MGSVHALKSSAAQPYAALPLPLYKPRHAATTLKALLAWLRDDAWLTVRLKPLYQRKVR